MPLLPVLFLLLCVCLFSLTTNSPTEPCLRTYSCRTLWKVKIIIHVGWERWLPILSLSKKVDPNWTVGFMAYREGGKKTRQLKRIISLWTISFFLNFSFPSNEFLSPPFSLILSFHNGSSIICCYCISISSTKCSTKYKLIHFPLRRFS